MPREPSDSPKNPVGSNPSGGAGSNSGGAAADVRTVAKGGAVQILGQVVSRGAAFLFVAFAARLLGTAGYGLYRQISQILTTAATLGPGGFEQAVLRFIARARAGGAAGEVRGSLRVGVLGATAISIAVSVAMFFAAGWIGDLLAETSSGAERMADLIRVGAAFVPLYSVMQVYRFATQAYKTIVPSVIVGNIVQPGVRFGLGAVALLMGWAVLGVIVMMIVSAIVGLVLAVYYWRRMLTSFEREAQSTTRPSVLIRFALPQAGVVLLSTQSLGLGVIILGIVGTNRAVGLFAVALSLQGPGGVFLTGISGIWAPVVADLHERGLIDRLDLLYKTINRWVMTFALPIFVALILEPRFFAVLLGGPQAADAAPLVVVLAIGNIAFVSTGPTSHVISMTGRPGINLANSIFAVALYIGAGMFAAYRYGAIGIAVADAAVTIVINIVRVVEGKILVGIQPFGRTLLKPIGATAGAAVVYLAIRAVFGISLPVGLIAAVLATGVYLALLAVMGLEDQERDVWNRMRARLRPGARS